MDDIWYKDPKTGEIYQDRKDSKGRTVRTYIEHDREPPRSATSSGANDARVPRSRRDSVYSTASVEASSSHDTRGKSRIRGPIREEEDRTSTTHYDAERHQPFKKADRRQEDDLSDPYVAPTSRRKSTTEYHAQGGYDKYRGSSASQDYQLPQHRDFGSQDPLSVDSLTEGIGGLRVSRDESYTFSPSTQRQSAEWHPPPSEYEESTLDSGTQITSQTSYSGSTVLPSQSVVLPLPSDRRHVAGTPGYSETIDKTYTVRNYDWKKFFRVGRVFSTLWTDAMGANSDRVNPTFVSEVSFGEKVYSKVRRFIVVREGDRSVTCLPVTSYDGLGHRKSGIRLEDHGYIFSRRAPKRVDGLRSKALRVVLSKGNPHFREPSLVNYAKVYTVETNVKVKDIGDLDEDSKGTLLYYFKKVFSGVEDETTLGPGYTPRITNAVLAGVGAAHENYSVPETSSQHMPTTTAGSGFVSAPVSSGYPPPHSYNQPREYGGATRYSATAVPGAEHRSNAAGTDWGRSSMYHQSPAANPGYYNNNQGHGPADYYQGGAHHSTNTAYQNQFSNPPAVPVAASPYQFPQATRQTVTEPLYSPLGTAGQGYYQHQSSATTAPNTSNEYHQVQHGSGHASNASGHYQQYPAAEPRHDSSSSYYPQQPGSGHVRTSSNSHYPQPPSGDSRPLAHSSHHVASGPYTNMGPSNPYSRSDTYPEAVIEDEDDIDLPSLEAAQRAKADRKRRESTTDSTNRRHRRYD